MVAILLLAPGILAAAYYCYLKKYSIKSLNFLIYSVLFIFLINLFVFSLAYLRGHKDVLSNEMFSILGNAVRYGQLAGAGAFLFPHIVVLISRIQIGKKHE